MAYNCSERVEDQGNNELEDGDGGRDRGTDRQGKWLTTWLAEGVHSVYSVTGILRGSVVVFFMPLPFSEYSLTARTRGRT